MKTEAEIREALSKFREVKTDNFSGGVKFALEWVLGKFEAEPRPKVEEEKPMTFEDYKPKGSTASNIPFFSR